jgi:hypothetical protein
MRVRVREIRYAICLSAASQDDLDVGKIYHVLPDPPAAEVECLRVIDESGKDYLYPARRFVIVELPEKVRRRLLKLAKKQSA